MQKEKSASILREFKTNIETKLFISPHETGLLAVSGGLDSMVMADLFYRGGYKFAVAHGNFSLRGKDSDQDENFVLNWCASRNIHLHVKRFDTIKCIEEEKISIQMAARKLRYAWFEEICTEFNYGYYCTAHHQNDVLETILMNITRGTGIAGLRGILEKSGKLIRPLLLFTREELLKESENLNIHFREDSSNASLKYVRNRIRQEIVPVLKKINPNIEKTISFHLQQLQWTEFLAQEKLFSIKEDMLEKHPLSLNRGDSYKLEKRKIQAFGRFIPEVLFSILDDFSFNYAQCSQISNALESQSGGQFFSKTYKILIDRDYIFLTPLIIIEGSGQYSTQLTLEKNLDIRWIYHPEEIRYIKESLGLVSPFSFNLPIDNYSVYLNGELVDKPLHVRFWENGDAFTPLGMNQSKKISDFFIDLKIPIFEKDKIPLLCHGEEIIWVVGYRISNLFKVDKNTSKIIALNYH